jgi:hypothetical protein
MAFKKKTRDEIQRIAASAVKDAVDFIESEIAPQRIKAQRYYNGAVDLPHEDGRSKVVATKVRDNIRAIKPSLMRVFMSSGRYVEYQPRGMEDRQLVMQATAAAHAKMEELGGFGIFSDVFHDALLKKMGFTKIYYEEYSDAETHTLTGLSEEQRTAIHTDPEVIVVSEEMDGMGYEMKLQVQRDRGDICIVTVPPEEFFIDRAARSIDDFYVCGHRTDMRLGDLIGMGYDIDSLPEISGTTESGDVGGSEDDERRGYSGDDDEDGGDEAMRKVMVTEAYMRIDVDGTGVPVLHKILMGGTGYVLIDYEAIDDVPFATFEVDPEAHAFFGHSVADLIMDDQDASTSILRGILDNVAMVNNPAIEVVEGMVNIDDVLNNEIGAVRRVKQPGMITTNVTPFVAGQTLPAMQYYDAQIEGKTGVTRASMGLDPDALQSTTRAGVNATIQAAAGQSEVMARNLAEGGVKRLFKQLLKLMIKHPDAARFARINGEFVQIDPRSWDANMDVSVNVGLGTGREDERQAAFRELLALQMQVMQGYGPGNGIVSLSNITNTVTDMLAGAGVRNAERYFTQMSPEQEQQMMAQRAQAAQGQQSSDPNAAFMQVEQMKAQAKSQGDMMRLQLDAQKARMDDDRQRDKMAQDFALQNTKLQAEHGRKVNEMALKAEQNRDRY